MRKLKVTLIAMLLLISGSIFASSNKEVIEPTKSLSAQIADFLKENSFNAANEDLKANVLFMVNRETEIVVLSVKTSNQRLEKFVKERLNYQKVNMNNYREGRTYTVPVRIE